MKQIIYLGGKKARNYTAPHEETDVIGDCDWKEGDVKTEGVDYKYEPKHTYWNEVRAKEVSVPAAIYPFPIPKQEGEDIYDSIYMEVVELVEKDNIQCEEYKATAEKLKQKFTITRKS